jgi:tetraacyldisaccharide 4'-kinase
MKPPLFWFRDQSLWALALTPLSWVWRSLSSRRWRKGAHRRLRVPVICVGNINMGGTGKTPTVIALVGQLQAMGKTPHVVSRGYGGEQQGPTAVDLRRHSADDVGDEPLLLAAFAPCWVARDRAAGATAALAAGADVIVLDDGMQNPALVKDLTIMVVDAQTGFGNGRVFPAGPLRQTVADGLARADAVLVIGPPAAQSGFSARWGEQIHKPLLTAQLAPLQTGMDWQGLRALAFAGIGRPEKFFDTLAGLGAEIVATRSFGDHEKLPLAVLQRMEKQATALGAQLVTTEKDAARLPASFQQKVLTLPVRLELEDPKVLEKLLRSTL